LEGINEKENIDLVNTFTTLRRTAVNRFETKRLSHFATAVIVLMAYPLFAVAQGTVPVNATAGPPNPAWVPYGLESQTTLSATTTDPTPDSGSTLQGPNWEWTVQKVEFSDDGVNFSQGGAYDVFILPPTNAATVTLSCTFFQGAYWRITCQATVGYSETPGTMTWTGTGTCETKPNSGELVSITVTSGATQKGLAAPAGQNWAAVKTKAGDTVVVTATVKPNTADVAKMIKWTGGKPAADNLSATVDKGTSAMTPVTAQIGTAAAQEVDIWIIWADVTIQLTDNLAKDNDCKLLTDNAGKWPDNLGGGTGLGAIDHDAVAALTYGYTVGRMQATGKLTPAGIGKVVSTTGWKLNRTREDVGWDNGGHYTGATWAAGPSIQDAAGTSDISAGGADSRTWDPTSGGKVDTIYTIDAPGCSCVLPGITINHTSEIYVNFTQWVSVTLDAETICSSNAIWSYQAQVDGDKAAGKRIDLNKLDTAAIDIAARIKAGPNYAMRK
jgi:hypothetical protein